MSAQKKMITVSCRLELRIKKEKRLYKLTQSFESNPATQNQASGGNKPPLRPVLFEGKWERVVIRQVPAPGAGAMAWGNTASWDFPCLRGRNTNTPAQAAQCRNAQFG